MTRSVLVLVLLTLATAACDRPLIDAIDSELVITDPDLDVVLLDPELTLRFDTASPLAGATVVIEGEEIERDSVNGGFVYETSLATGLNRLRVEITDAAGEITRDTLYAVYLPIRFRGPISATSAFQRVGAAAAAFGDGRTLITGGVGANETPLSTASVVSIAGSQISTLETSLQEARRGHSASLLPDGQILVLGGVRTSGTPSPEAFIEQAETVSPDNLTSTRLLDSEVLRAGHTTRILRRDGRTTVYVFGGIVPSGSGFAPSETADIFEYIPGSPPRLDRLSPSGGVGAFVPVINGLQIPTAAQESVVFGLLEDGESAAQQLVWRFPGTVYPFSLTAPDARPLATPRQDADGVSLGNLQTGRGLALVIGGRDAQGQALASLEVYAAEIDRTFRFPEGAELAAPRFGHTATILGGSRILIAGGRGSSGAALNFLEILQL